MPDRRGRIGAGRRHAIRTLRHYTDNMDNVRNRGSAVRCSVFKELREEGGGAWEADALPTELFPHSDLRVPYLDLGPNRGQRIPSYHAVIKRRAALGVFPAKAIHHHAPRGSIHFRLRYAAGRFFLVPFQRSDPLQSWKLGSRGASDEKRASRRLWSTIVSLLGVHHRRVHVVEL